MRRVTESGLALETAMTEVKRLSKTIERLEDQRPSNEDLEDQQAGKAVRVLTGMFIREMFKVFATRAEEIEDE